MILGKSHLSWTMNTKNKYVNDMTFMLNHMFKNDNWGGSLYSEINIRYFIREL